MSDLSSSSRTGDSPDTVAGLRERLEQAEQRVASLCHEAEELQKSKQEWLANITHELRTPMHGIMSFARFGIKNVEHAERAKLAQYFDQINASAERLMSLLNNLLDLSKCTSAQQVYVFEQHDLMDLVNAVVFEFNAAVREKELTVRFAAETKDTVVMCDQARVRQVLSNVLVNSIKYSAEGKSLIFSFARLAGDESSNGDVLKIGLRDEGIGIPEEELETVFDQFIQSSRTRNRAGGTGLGLSICREIVRAHGGRMWAENNSESEGTTVFFTLPYEQEERRIAG